MPTISNQELNEADIPGADADLRSIGRFAETFPIVEHPRYAELSGAKGRERLFQVTAAYRDRGELPSSLSELRACLLMEWALLPYLAPPSGPSTELMEFMTALVSKIRTCVHAGIRD
jgi:hypothetical protein